MFSILLLTMRSKREKTRLFQRELAKMPSTQPRWRGTKAAREPEARIIETERAELRAKLRDLDNVIVTLRTHVVPPLDADEARICSSLCPRRAVAASLDRMEVRLCQVHIRTATSRSGLRATIRGTCSETAWKRRACFGTTARCVRGAGNASIASGCIQMWCTMCATAFSWRTGTVINGATLHNPHYYDYMQQRLGRLDRNPADIPCGGMPTYRELVMALSVKSGTHQSGACANISTHRLVAHTS